MNEGRQDMYLYDFFSLFLGVQSAFEVGATSYETPCIRCFEFLLDKFHISANSSDRFALFCICLLSLPEDDRELFLFQASVTRDRSKAPYERRSAGK